MAGRHPWLCCEHVSQSLQRRGSSGDLPTESCGGEAHGCHHRSNRRLDVHQEIVTAAVRSPGKGRARSQQIREFRTYTGDDARMDDTSTLIANDRAMTPADLLAADEY